jgi:hypothetical protein
MQTEVHAPDIAFADVHLQVGEVLNMQAQGVADEVTYQVRFIGALEGHSLITTLPMAGGKGIWIPPGSTFVFRTLWGIYALAFTCRALRAHSRPYPYVHFSYPESVRSRQIRVTPRHATRLPVEAIRGDGTRTLAILRDISLHGAHLELTAPLGVIGAGCEFVIPLILPEVVSQLKLPGTIRNASNRDRAMAEGRFRYGIEFGTMNDQDAMLLHYFIDHLLAERLGGG